MTDGIARTNRDDRRIAVVLVALNARGRLERSLPHLIDLPERQRIILVDNASTDGTSRYVERRFPEVDLIRLSKNLGAAGRNIGVLATDAPYVAFAEDDSWYEPGALLRAIEIFDRHAEIGLINSQILVGEDEHSDPIHEDMVDTPVPERWDLPGHRILSFLEGASIVRREAFTEVGGFDPRFAVGGPEEHLAADLLSAGWELRYVPDVRSHHLPDHSEPSPAGRRLGLRNTLWFAWSRRPLRPALRWTAHVLRTSPADGATVRGVGEALSRLPWLPRERNPLPARLEADMALLDSSKLCSKARCYAKSRGDRD
jgi:GT2 family glycosyltransferase